MIGLLTDFGMTDTYVGSLKAAIYKVAPEVPIVDVCHYIQPQNVKQGAFVLGMVYKDYPAGTIFVGVVDPGVGGSRLPIAVSAGGLFFVGPDNGLFSVIYEREKIDHLVQLDKESLWQHPVSSTFHGRDIFAPSAAHLSKTSDLKSIGSPLKIDPKKIDLPKPEQADDGKLVGTIRHMDRFGNLITNIHRETTSLPIDSLHISDWEIQFGRTYGDTTKDALIALWNSTGFLEISARNGSARDVLDCELGEELQVTFKNPGS